MTACGYCFRFVEYCSKKAMYKIQRGKLTALVSTKIVQRNLIVLSSGRNWYALEDFGLHGEEIP